jgi:putative SOS response-associated peptidase YedK
LQLSDRPLHDRMPMLLRADEWDQWSQGSFDDASHFWSRVSRIA